jgi:hypothetical protein
MNDLVTIPEPIPNLNPKEYPEIGRYRKIVQWQLDFCDGDFAQAIILSFFIAMYEFKRDIYIEAMRMDKSESMELVYSYSEIKEHILKSVRDKETLVKKINLLKEKKIISIRKSTAWERKNIYTFNPEPILKFLSSRIVGKLGEFHVEEAIKLLKSRQLLIKDKDRYVLKTPETKQSAVKHLPEKQVNTTSHVPTWNDFIDWSSKNLGKNRFDTITKIKINQSGKILTINDTVDKFTRKLVEKYFANHNVKTEFKGA